MPRGAPPEGGRCLAHASGCRCEPCPAFWVVTPEPKSQACVFTCRCPTRTTSLSSSLSGGARRLLPGSPLAPHPVHATPGQDLLPPRPSRLVSVCSVPPAHTCLPVPPAHTLGRTDGRATALTAVCLIIKADGSPQRTQDMPPSLGDRRSPWRLPAGPSPPPVLCHPAGDMGLCLTQQVWAELSEQGRAHLNALLQPRARARPTEGTYLSRAPALPTCYTHSLSECGRVPSMPEPQKQGPSVCGIFQLAHTLWVLSP